MAYIDLQSALRDWPYEADKISVRKILGVDGTMRIQMRVEMGILQMEAQGRPDGARPRGSDSLVAFHRMRLAKHEQRNGTALGFGLARSECEELRTEASLFYRRYVAFFVLEEYSNVYRDTSHSLAIFDFCRDHALESEDRLWLEKFRAHALMMDARARAYHALEENEPASALAHVNRGIMSIRSHFEEYGQPEPAGECEEIRMLQLLGNELSAQVPKDSLIVTRKALRIAIEQERFEEAARLRDTLKNMYPPQNG